jgi:hypothetical protein
MADPSGGDEVVSLVVDKEGSMQHFSKKAKKWKPKWGVLSGGGLYTKNKQKDPEMSEPIVIKGATIASTDEHKKKFAIKINEECVAFDTEAERGEWLEALKANIDKEVGKGDKTKSKKTQSAAMRIKKKAVGAAATSSAGKGMIKEFLGKDGVKLLDLIKQIITAHEGKKKAVEVEENIIRVAVKVILLWQNKDLTNADITGTVPKVKAVWSDIIDFCEMSFAYDPPKIKSSGDELIVCFTTLLKDYVTEATITTMKATINYITTQALLDSVFVAEGQDDTKKELMRILRGGWIAAFGSDKN